MKFTFQIIPKKRPSKKKILSKKYLNKLQRDVDNKNKPKKRKKKKETKKEKRSFSSTMSLIKECANLLRFTFGKVKIKINSLKVFVSAEDSFKTAMEYGVANMAMSAVVEIFRRYTQFDEDGCENIIVLADYLSGKTTFDIDIDASMRVYNVISILIKGLSNKKIRKLFTK